MTTGAYNDGKRGFLGWDEVTEKRLFEFVDKLNSNGTRFMLSHVIEHKEETNIQLQSWIRARGYRLITIPKIPGRKRKEVLVVNKKEVLMVNDDT